MMAPGQTQRDDHDAARHEHTETQSDPDHERRHSRPRALAQRLLRDVAGWAAAFTSIAAVVGTEAAEDAVDLVHSVWASRESLRLATTLEPSRRNGVVLPERMAASAHSLFARSLAYFWADVLWIALQRAHGGRPHMWAGRLAHHAIQTVANLPVLLSAGRPRCVMSAYLGLAYSAEVSTVCLRLGRLLRRLQARRPGGGGLLRLAPAAARLNQRALLLAFVLFRLVNFPVCGGLIWRNRAELPPATARAHAAFAALGYVVNVAWFAKMCRGSG